MIDLIKTLKTQQGRIIISIIWGLGLACLFRKVCIGRDCIVYKAPNPNLIKNNVFLHDKKCYKFDSESTQCNETPIEWLNIFFC